MVIPDHQNDENPFRYPFADIFIYAYDQKHDILTYTKWKWRNWLPGVGFDPLSKWPNGTTLTAFGSFEMRISIKNEQYLQSLFSSNCMEVGVTQCYDHYYNFPIVTTAFRIPQTLLCPAKPFSIPLNLRGFGCNEIS